MNYYERLIENPLFFKWIYHPSDEINSYWEHYLEAHPEHAIQIKEIKTQFEKHLLYRKQQLTEPEKKALARRIILQLEKTEQKKYRLKTFRSVMRYAAVAFLFFVIGSSLVYLYMEGRQPEVIVDQNALPARLQEPLLIIDNEERISLNEGKSELSYSTDGQVTINQKQRITEENSNQPPRMNTLVIPYGSRSEVTLADGSRVWLNAGSRLIYPNRFVDKTREVFLTGEAFFEVAQDEKHPFVVKTVDVKVEVLGTRFNISAYPEDYSVQTVLEEGGVSIKKAEAGLFEKAVKLTPGKLAYFNKKSKETSVYSVDVEQYTLWKEGLFSFSNTDFNRIVKKLERYYNIHFQFDDPFKGSIQVTGKLDVTQGREEVFEYLERLTGLTFMQISERQYIIK